MSISFAPDSFEIRKVADMSYYVFEDDVGIIIPYPTRLANNGIKTLLDPFEINVYTLSTKLK